MMNQRLIMIGIATALMLPALAVAHPEHAAHKVMGTVTMVAADHVMIKATDGKEVTIGVNADTKVMTGKIGMKLADIKTGARIIATVASEKAPFTATVIAVGAPAAVAQKKG